MKVLRSVTARLRTNSALKAGMFPLQALLIQWFLKENLETVTSALFNILSTLCMESLDTNSLFHLLRFMHLGFRMSSKWVLCLRLLEISMEYSFHPSHYLYGIDSPDDCKLPLPTLGAERGFP